ncbi:methyl-accepting chemotaxis protein [Pelomonas sp. SE-A7]|uniref:methyl-accepting chemotaxis protein n=1 Tax=Pelomonas sp. SE-A7 TaxID=3054953 RepID=UPI00259D0AEA|nr:methyl-accepting chemotaxis protein [Pelomonas sp. SE-A7]MDM4766324.1 methyl-accepting chemotaxis protein [Pelomonas sp. SE-A7]
MLLSLNSLRVKAKLMLGFVALATVVLLVSGLALNSLGKSNARFSQYLEGVGLRERLATDIRGAASRRAIAARNLVLVSQPRDREAERLAVTQAHQDMGEAVARLRDVVAKARDVSERDRQLLAEIEQVEARYGPVALAIVGTALDGKRDEAVLKMNAECRPLLAALLKATGDYIRYEQDQAGQRVQQALADFSSDRLTLFGVCALAILAAIAMGWLLSNAVTRPLLKAVNLAEAVAGGDLSSDIQIDRRDELGQLQAALRKMNESLVTMVGQVRDSADGIATASQQIASGNQDLSSRTEQQASALQQTAASMQQMTSTVQHAAESSRQATQLAGSAAAVAGRGGEVVGRVVSTMGEISEASRRIADIIGVIDGIAFQTNILALNAAVEAARAGDQGRGFAVVAGEVRALAQRSAQAAREIKVLITASVEKVEAGSRLVGEAGSTMGDIVSQVQRMTDLMSEINASADEQSSGIVQVNQAVASIDQGTQRNAALVEESAAAAEALRQQAAALQQVIAQFKTSSRGAWGA